MTFEEFDKVVLQYFETNNWKKLHELIIQHDELIIKNWNNVVGKNDVVWFLGDFCFGRRDIVKQYKDRLNGICHMILGNHDNYSDKIYLDAGFRTVSRYPVILKGKFILSHAPLQNVKKLKSFYNIFGHVHSLKIFKNSTKRYSCVCLERSELTPARLPIFESYREPVFEEYITKS